jgi:phosphate transport system substrate-binding protein
MISSKNSVRIVCAIAGMLFFQNPALATETMRVGGTGATNEMVKSLGSLFAAETGINVELIPSLGTGGGNNAVADGVIDLCISGRPLNAAEIAKGLTIVAELQTPFGLVTSESKPNGLKSTEIAQVYQSDKPAWANGTPIKIILRPTNESDTWALGRMFPGMEQAITTITTEKRNLRFVAIDGVEPSVEAYEKGSYPFGKSLYLVLAAKRSPAGERFLAFLHSPKGVVALREAGIILSAK